uniref:SWI/SNF-like complex subunit BAF250 C-terminal domain-containing protein n=1 Tax=Panagrolaimus sp. ES5 TaxID=591445 RepID=A0AC34GG01_9BILA
MGEETPIREFALVIMSALCQASESVCVIAALKTNIIRDVVKFLECVDATIHQVVSIKGMEYRNHADQIGTTPGMLKKAVSILLSIIQYEACRKPFIKFSDNFIKLIVSQFVDPELITPLASLIHMIQPAIIKNGIPVESFNFPDIRIVDFEK